MLGEGHQGLDFCWEDKGMKQQKQKPQEILLK